MRKYTDLMIASALILAGVVPLALPAVAQEPKPAAMQPEKLKPVATYKLDFTLTELEENTRVNSRSYSLLVEEEAWGRARIGTRVPISLGDGKGIQYMDVGFSLDTRINQRAGDLRLELRLEVNSFVPAEGDAARPREPVLRSMRSELAASIVPGKPTLLTTVDELGSRRRFQVEVTATRVR
ncbi:MAG: hypothetical protein ACRD2Q_12385 [Terriglobales bacterium]